MASAWAFPVGQLGAFLVEWPATHQDSGVDVDLAWGGNILAVIYLVWVLNLYNFMDGIDGIASVQAIFVCLGMCINYWISGNANLLTVPLVLSAAVAGFLYWNFPQQEYSWVMPGVDFSA